MAFGDYPLDYNPKVHGPYDPSRFYGKADTPLAQVKLGELIGWISRRNRNPRAFAGCVSRGYWRWQQKYMQPKRAGSAGFFQFMAVTMAFFYLINYGRISTHRNYKYH